MSASLVGLLWGGWVLVVAWQRRPLPLGRRPAPGAGIAAPLAEHVLRRAGRVAASDARRRRIAVAVLAGAASAALLPMAAPAAALAAWVAPDIRARRHATRAAADVRGSLPEVVDLLALAVGAGLTVPAAVEAVGRRGHGPLAAALQRVAAEIRHGRRCADALDDLPSRLGDAVRPLTAALVASERYGVPLAAGLDRLAAELRDDRRRQAEAAARAVPVKLLFPLVLCVLPAFGLLTVAPLLAGAFGSLRL